MNKLLILLILFASSYVFSQSAQECSQAFQSIYSKKIEEGIRRGDLSIIQEAIKAGADFAYKHPKFNGTFLHYASYVGSSVEVIKFFIEQGLDMNGRDKKGETPLDIAIIYNHREIIDFLRGLKAAQTIKNIKEVRLRMFLTKIIKSIKEDNMGLMKEALSKEIDFSSYPFKHNSSPLHYAAHLGRDQEMLQALLEAGFDINQRANNGMTPLDKAIVRNHTHTIEFLKSQGAKIGLKNEETVKKMDVMRRLILGMKNNDLDNVKEALATGEININERNTIYGGGFIHWALASERDAEIILALLEAGSEIHSINNEGLSPLDIAFLNGDQEIISILESRGAKHHAQNLERIKKTHLTGKLVRAIKSNAEISLVKQILKRGENILDVLNETSQDTPLHLVAHTSRNLEIVQALLDFGMDMNAVNSQGETPLDVAIRLKNKIVFTYLYKKGAKTKRFTLKK